MTNFYRRVFCAPAVASGATAGYFNVAVVRHPEDRVVSAFLDKFCGEDRGEHWVRRAAEAAHPDGDPSFADFLGYLETVDERRCDPHWRRQSYVLDGHAIDAFVRLERLAEDFDAISDRVGRARLDRLGAKLQRSAGAPRAATAPIADASRLKASEIVARRATEGDFPPEGGVRDRRDPRADRADLRARLRDAALRPAVSADRRSPAAGRQPRPARYAASSAGSGRRGARSPVSAAARPPVTKSASRLSPIAPSTSVAMPSPMQRMSSSATGSSR